MAQARKKNLFGWATKKRVTYHRDVASERAQRQREEKAQAAELARALTEVQQEWAYDLGKKAKQAGKKPDVRIDSGLVLSSAKKTLGSDKAYALAKRFYVKGYRQNPCARTVKAKVSDRAKRYRANQPGCRPSGLKKCKLCGSKSDVMVDHVDGNESNGRKSNLRWLCRSCNNTLGAEMAKTGEGRRTVQYNPEHKGALTLGEYMQAVLQHTRGSHDAAGKIIHETPKSRRQAFASEIWARRESHGTTRPGSGQTGQDEPDWVTNPAASAAQYRLAQAVLSGQHLRTPARMTKAAAREIVDRTPAHLRSEYARNPALEFSTEYHLGYNLGQADRQSAQLRKTIPELHATFEANFAGSPSAQWESFEHAYAAGYSGQLGSAAPAGGTNPRTSNARHERGLSKTNPEGDLESEAERATAGTMAKLFHGRAVKEVLTLDETIVSHDWEWKIGPVVKLKVRTILKEPATFKFSLKEGELVQLWCSPDGKQFYFRGGDQEIDLQELGLNGPEWFRDKMEIGEAIEITYQDQKSFHRFNLIDYYHKLGEVTRKKPRMMYDTLSKRIQIWGGQYYVETRELVDGVSPGIVN